MVMKSKYGKGVLSLVKREKYCKIYLTPRGPFTPTSNKEGDPRNKAVLHSNSFCKNSIILSYKISLEFNSGYI